MNKENNSIEQLPQNTLKEQTLLDYVFLTIPWCQNDICNEPTKTLIGYGTRKLAEEEIEQGQEKHINFYSCEKYKTGECNENCKQESLNQNFETHIDEKLSSQDKSDLHKEKEFEEENRKSTFLGWVIAIFSLIGGNYLVCTGIQNCILDEIIFGSVGFYLGIMILGMLIF